MSSKVEEVAKAICKACDEACWDGEDRLECESCPEPCKVCVAEAKAAILALREPSEEMAVNGVNAIIDFGLDSLDGVGLEDSKACYRAMIDAALDDQNVE